MATQKSTNSAAAILAKAKEAKAAKEAKEKLEAEKSTPFVSVEKAKEVFGTIDPLAEPTTSLADNRQTFYAKAANLTVRLNEKDLKFSNDYFKTSAPDEIAYLTSLSISHPDFIQKL